MAALAGREGPGVTEAMLGCLADPDENLRRAAATALARREGPEVTEALLGLLTDPDENLRRAAAEGLGRRESPESVLTLAKKVRGLSQSSLLAVLQAAELLMIRHYRQIDPADQSEVLAAMGWLTTATLSGRSA